MSPYRLPHDLAGEQQRLALMSALLDPVDRVYVDRLGVGPGWRCLELGSGNGSIAKILAQLVGPTGHVVASDIDLSFMAGLETPNLEVRRIDVLQDKMEEGFYDFVAARALLHHLPGRWTALERMVKAVKPGGAFLSIEPDMLPQLSPSPSRCACSGTLGSDGRSRPASTISSAAKCPPCWTRSDCKASAEKDRPRI
jgi:SAM-dependent methyltransferase